MYFSLYCNGYLINIYPSIHYTIFRLWVRQLSLKRSEWYSRVNLHQNAKYLDVFKPDAYFLVDWPLASAQKIT